MTHELKCWPAFFNKIRSGEKNFEVRKNDRYFQEGDELLLKEFIPQDDERPSKHPKGKFTIA